MGDNIFRRIGRGLKVMYSKIVNSSYVQNIKAEQDSGKVNPDEFSTDFGSLQTKEEDVFATKF